MYFDVKRLILGGVAIAIVRSVLTVLVQQAVIAPLFLDEMMQRIPEAVASIASTPRLVLIVISLVTGLATSLTYWIMRRAFPSRWQAALAATIPLWLLATMQWLITAAMGLFSWQHVFVEAAVMLPAALVATYVGGMVVDAGRGRAPFGELPYRVDGVE